MVESTSNMEDVQEVTVNNVKILVARHDVYYNDEIDEDNQQQREYSEIIYLRKFNNFIKSVLINQYCSKLDYQYKPSIFDMCSGKGGDIGKWVKKGPSHYVGLEYQSSLIDKAVKRVKENRNINFPCIFLVADAGDPHTKIDHVLDTHESFKGIKKKVVFDIVSCQFSMHYLWEGESQLRTFLHNVTCRLEPGGFYIGTTVDAERVVARIRTDGKETLQFGNPFFSIQFGQESFPLDESPYGQKFYFYLKEAVGRERLTEDRPVYVPEYLVNFGHMEKIALEYDLELVEKKNFHEYYDEHIDRNSDLFYRMVQRELDGRFTEEAMNQQWEICGMYLIFAFRKRGEKRKRTRDNFGNLNYLTTVNVKDWR